MLRMSFTLYRRADLSPEQFRDYWINNHAPLVLQFADVMGIERYVQLHADYPELAEHMTRSRASAPPHDGVVQIWYLSAAHRLQAIHSEAGRDAARLIVADEARFCDMSRSSVCFGTDHVIFDRSSERV